MSGGLGSECEGAGRDRGVLRAVSFGNPDYSIIFIKVVFILSQLIPSLLLNTGIIIFFL